MLASDWHGVCLLRRGFSAVHVNLSVGEMLDGESAYDNRCSLYNGERSSVRSMYDSAVSRDKARFQ